jgi:ATP-dependent DNA ligase
MQLHPEAVSEFRFIQPCSPIPAKTVPTGDGWVHEVKFEAYRVQAHERPDLQPQWARLHRAFPSTAQLLHDLPAKSAVLDGEVVASDRRPSELRQAARALEQAAYCPPVGIRPARVQRP